METLKQLLNIPDNHKLHFDVTLPDNFPPGPTELLKLAGSLKNSPHFGGDPLEIQKALRDEWKIDTKMSF